jgi:ADP-heptose:LPS heptosyltransferase
MLIHWHTETGEDALLRQVMEGCLEALYGQLDAGDTAIHSWGPPEAPLPYLQYPDGRCGNAASWQALNQAARPDLQVVLRAEIPLGATLSLGRESGYPTRRSGWWTWTEAAQARVPESWRELPRTVLYPRLPQRQNPRPAGSGGEARVVGLAPDGEGPDAWRPWIETAQRLRQELPDVRLKLVLDPAWLQRRWEARLNGTEGGGENRLPFPVRLDLTGCDWVVFAGREIDWGPAVLQALDEQRHVAAPEDAAYSDYLARERGHFWRPDTSVGGRGIAPLAALLQAARADPAEWEAQARRARAWSRRWSPAREAMKLQVLLDEARRRQGPSEAAPEGLKGGAREEGEGGAGVSLPAPVPRPAPGPAPPAGSPLSPDPRPSPSRRALRWTLRREVGIGDVIFTLSVAWALKQRDPGGEVTVHTAPQHAEWVRWFPFLAAVTTGEFSPDPGVRVGDFEAQFPSSSPLDRTLALGQVIGVEPKGWTPPPQIPGDVLAQAKELLGPGEGLRIAFVARSRGGSEARSLPPAVAEETGRQLSALGEVVWLDEAPRLSSPCLQPHNHRTLHPTTDLTGRLTLPQAVAVLSLCDLCVSVDTGLLHLAVTLRKPVVGLFSHIGALQRLWLAPSFLALQPSLPCAPCGEGADAFHCRQNRSPFSGSPLPCVSLLRAEAVVEAAREALSRSGRRVWNMAPDGGWTVWEVDAVPVPWPSATFGNAKR